MSVKTYFAPARRAGKETLDIEIDLVSKNDIMSGLLHSISGVLAILNDKRQVVALNDSFLKLIGIDDPAEQLGLRPGEILNCVHADEEPGGCGTTKYCSTCGAAVAIVSSLGQDKPVERNCALTTSKEGNRRDLSLLVRSHPINLEGKKFLLLFLQDISLQQHRASLERTFFHDINNMLSLLFGLSRLQVNQAPSKLAENIHNVSMRLTEEVAIQRSLMQSEACCYLPKRTTTTAVKMLSELQEIFTTHPVAEGKHLEVNDQHATTSLITDTSLLLRILSNMLINAFEASGPNETVKLWLERGENCITFCVWNAQPIPTDIQRRVFQRNFSTKKQAGRGIGTYSMKLFGEEILGGHVDFNSSSNEGTCFRFSLDT